MKCKISFKERHELGMVAHVFIPDLRRQGAGSLRVWSQPDLISEFHDSQCYTERHCHKEREERRKEGKTGVEKRDENKTTINDRQTKNFNNCITDKWKNKENVRQMLSDWTIKPSVHLKEFTLYIKSSIA